MRSLHRLLTGNGRCRVLRWHRSNGKMEGPLTLKFSWVQTSYMIQVTVCPSPLSVAFKKRFFMSFCHDNLWSSKVS